MLASGGVIIGIGLLIVGGTILVRGASEIAKGFGISPMVVGLTIVGFGTSSPELVVNIIAASQGANGIAFGNVVGSNISNLGLVLGVAAILSPIAIEGDLVRRELPLLLLATTTIAVMALDARLDGTPDAISRADAIVLLLMFGIFVYITAMDFVRARPRNDALLAEIEETAAAVAPRTQRWRWLLVLGGIVLLFIGGDLTIRNGQALAADLGVPTAIIGLFVVAVGTSMPELVTSIIAAMRKEADLALGNVIGSNIFNSLMVLPAGGVIAQVSVPGGGVADLIVSWLFAAVLIPQFFIGSATLGRITGVVFLACYLVYATWRILAA